MVTRAVQAALRTIRQRSMGLALLTTGLCVGVTNWLIRDAPIAGILQLLTVWAWGCFAAMFVLVVAYPLAAWYLGDRIPDMETATSIICAAIVAVCFWLVVVHFWMAGDDYGWE